MPKTNMRHESGRRLLLAAVLVSSAAILLLLAGHYAASMPSAHATDHQLTVGISAGVASPTNLTAVPFNLTFGRAVNALTLDESDIGASSGTVRDLRFTPYHDGRIDGTGGSGGGFNTPLGVITNGTGHLFVADSLRGRIAVFDPSGVHTATITDNISFPAGMTVNGTGHLFVADSTGDNVAVFGPDRRHVASTSTATGLSSPTDVATNSSGTMFVADTGNGLVRMFDPALAYTADLPYTFSLPRSVAVNGSDHIFVADSGNDRVAVLDPSLSRIAYLPGPFDNPSGVDTDGSGRIYVSDSDNNRLRVFGPALHSIANITDGFADPRGVTVGGSSGTVYVADSGGNGIAILDGTTYSFNVTDPADLQTLMVNMSAGRVQDPAGSANEASNTASIETDRTAPEPVLAPAQTGPTGATSVTFRLDFGEPVNVATLDATDIDATSGTVQNLHATARVHAGSLGGRGTGDGEFNQPYGVAVDGLTGDIFVTDHANARVQIFDSDRRFTGTLPGPFTLPTGVAVNGTGHIFVADGNIDDGWIVVFDSERRRIGTFRVLFETLSNMAINGTGHIFVPSADYDRILVLDGAGNRVTSFIDDFNRPRGVAADTVSGRIYVADTSHHVVKIYDSALDRIGIIGTVDTPGSGNLLHSPYGVAVDPVSGKIYVANNDGHRSVAVFDSALDRIGSLPHTFAEPVGVTFDGASGTVYVADRGAHLVQTFVADEYAFDVAAPADLQTLTVNMSAGRVQDRAGNPNVESNSASIYIDRTTRPTPIITSAQDSPTNASTIGFTVTWDERVNGFAAGDITVLGTADHGGVANFAGSGSLYTFDVVPTSDGTVRPEIAAGVARNALGNLNVAAVGPSITYEGTPPVPVITPVQQGPTNLQTVSFRMGFDKYMDAGTIEASDIVASSGTVQNMRFAPQHERNTGGLGTGNGQFFFPYGMALNGTGHLFVADSVNDRVAVYTPDLVHIDNITDNDAGDLLEEPLDVAINGTGHIFVASTDAYQIAVFDSAFRNIANITGNVGSGPQRFDEAHGVAVNGTGHIFVTGGNDRIQVFDRARNHVASIGSADANNPDFNSPRGMAFNGTGHLYVADRGNSRVAIYNPALDHTGDIPVRILAPTDVAIDGTTGNIYVVESALDSVQIFDSANRHIGTISDRIDPLGDKPTGAAVDSTTGTLYVTDQGINGVQLFNVNAYAFDVADPADQQTLTVTLPTGRVQDRAGNANDVSDTASIGIDRAGPMPAITTAQSSPTGAEKIRFRVDFGEPLDLATLNATDINATSGIVHSLHPIFAHENTFGSRGSGTLQFIVPGGVTVDSSSGDIYVADTRNDRVRIFDSDRQLIGTITNPGFDRPAGIALDGSGNIYVTQYDFSEAGFGKPRRGHTLLIFDSSRQHTGTISGFDQPFGVTVNGTGHIFVADRVNQRVAVYNSSLQLAYQLENHFVRPSGVITDGSDNLFVADAHLDSNGVSRVQVFDSARNPVANITEGLNRPYGMAIDESLGLLYVANLGSGIQIFNSTWDRIGHVGHSFSSPQGVALDGSSGKMYVTNAGAHQLKTFAIGAYGFDVSASANLQTLTVNMSAGRVLDLVGNPNVESNSVDIDIDRTTRPVPSITSGQDSPTNVSPIGFTVNWDAPVMEFAAGDITLSGEAAPAAVANFAGSGSLYTFDVVPVSDGTVRVDIAAGVARNALGNLNEATATFSIAYDGTPPVPVITPVPPDPTGLQTVPFHVGFDRYMDAGTIEASDIVASSGTVQNMRFAPQHERNTGGLGTGNGQFFFPYGMALNGTGHLFVADSVNDRVAVYTPDLVHIDNITDNDAGDLLEEPLDVAINGTGHIFVASTDAYQIAVFDSAFRNIANITGDVGSGPQRFDEAYGVAVNGTGHIFVTGGNDRIQVFDRARNHVASIGSADANNPDFNSPRGMAFNGTGHLYVADRGNSRVAIYNPALDHTGDIPVRISAPTDVAIDGTTGNIYVVESALDSVQIFDSANRHIGTISDRIDPLGDKPTGVAVDSTTGTLYVTDQGINGVQLFNVNAYAFDVAAPADKQTLTVSMPADRVTALNGVNNIASAQASIYVDRFTVDLTTAAPPRTTLDPVPFTLDFNRVISIATLNGTEDISRTSGTVSKLRPVLSPDGSVTGGFNQPRGIAVDQDSGRVYMADSYGHRTVVFNTTLQQVGTIGHGGNSFPWDVAVNGTGHVFVALAGAAGNRLSVYDAALQPVGTISGIRPGGVTVAADGTIYTTGWQDRVLRVFNTTLDAKTTPPSTITGLSNPRGIAVDDAVTGNIYVAERGHNRIAVFDSDLNRIGTIFGHPGSPLSNPTGVDTDTMGNIYVADKDNGQIEIYNSERVHMATVENSFNAPYDVAVDSVRGHIYVAELGNPHRVQALNVSSYLFEVAGATDRATLEVGIPAGAVLDPSGNANLASDTLSIEIDRVAPAVESASITAPDRLTIRYTEPVNATRAAYGGTLLINGEQAALVATDPLTGNGTDTHVLAITGTPASAANSTGTLTVDQTGLTDRVGDAVGTSRAFEQALTDGQPPSVVSAAVTGPNEVIIRYTEPVNATSATAYSNLLIDSSPRTLPAGYLTGNDTDTHTLTFTGTAAARTAAGSITINQIRLIDRADNALGDTASFSQALTTGQVPSAIITSTQTPPTNATTIGFQVDFSRAVTGFASTDITLTGTAPLSGGVKNFAEMTAGTTYTFNVTPTDYGTILVDIPAGAARDAADPSLPSGAAPQFSMLYDNRAPLPTVTSVQTDPTNSTTVSFAVNFTDPVTGTAETVHEFAATDITVGGDANPSAGVQNFVKFNGSSYAFTATATADGIIEVDVPAGGARDTAGNPSTVADQYTIGHDGTAPAPRITSVQGDGPTGASVITFRVGFGERVDGFAAGDIAVSGTSSPGPVTGFGPYGATVNYTFTVSPTTDGTVLVDIGAGAAHDDAGSPSTAADQFSITYDSTLRSTTITSAQSSPTNATTLDFTVDFGDTVTGFDRTDITLSNVRRHGGVVDFAPAGTDSNSYTFSVVPTRDIASLRVGIAAGAASYVDDGSPVGEAEFRIRYDGTPPRPVITSPQGGPTNSSGINFTVNWGEEVTGFTAADITLGGDAPLAGAGPQNFAGTGAVYTFNVTATADGTVTAGIAAGAVTDTAGNPNTAGALFRIVYDTVPPVATIVPVQAGPTNLATVPFGLSFDKPVDASTLDVQDINVTSGTVQNMHHVLEYDSDIRSGFSTPRSLAVDGNTGYLYVANPGNQDNVRIFNSSGGLVHTITHPDFNSPWGVAVDSATGYVYVSDVNRASSKVFVFDSEWNHVADISGFRDPADVAVDPARNRLYVADTTFSRIQIFNLESRNKIADLGGFSTFSSPNGVAVDGTTGNLYVADTNNNLVKIYDINRNLLHTIDNGFNRPTGVAVDGTTGYIYVASRDNNQVQVFDSGRNHLQTVTSEHISGSFSLPSGIAVDARLNTAYVSDRNNNRILVFDITQAFEVANPAEGRLGVNLLPDSVRDLAGNENEGSGIVRVEIDRTAPAVASANITGPDRITVSYTKPVTSASGSAYGTPVIDGVTRSYAADRMAGEGTQVHVLALAPTGAAVPANATGTLAIDQRLITDAATNALGTGASFVRDLTDGQPPSVASAAVTGPQQVTFRYTEPVTAAADGAAAYGNLRIDGGARTLPTGHLSGSGTDTHTLTFTGTPAARTHAGAITVDQGRLADLTGNALGTDTAFEQTLTAGQAPTAAVTSVQAGPTNTAPIGFRVDFSHAVTGFDADDIILGGTAPRQGDGVTAFTEATAGTTYTFEVTPSDYGTVTVEIPADAARDAANPSLPSEAAPPFSILYDNRAPVPAVTSAQHPGPTNEALLNLEVDFAEPVRGFDAADIELAWSTSTGVTAANFAGADGDTVYTFDVVPPEDGTLTVDIAAGAATDEAGNPSTAAVQYPIRYDDEAPGVLITSSRDSPTGASTIGFTVTFTEPVSGFTAADISLTNASKHGGVAGFAAAADDGRIYTFNVVATANATIRVDIAAGAATDEAGNGNTAAPRFAMVYDDSLLNTEITSEQADPTNAATIGFTVDFGDPVNGFAPDDIALGGTAAPSGGVASFAGADGDAAYTFDVVPTRDGTVTVSVPENAATYAGSGDPTLAAQFSIRYDGSAPFPAVGSVQSGPTGAPTINFWINFTDSTSGDPEPVEGFAAGDISLAGSTARLDGGVKNFVRVNGFHYTFEATPTADGAVTVDVPAGAAGDEAGNPSTAAAPYSVVYDGPPSIVSAQVTGPNQMTIRYTEPVVVNATDSAYDGFFYLAGDSEKRAFRLQVGPSMAGPLMLAGNGTAVHTLGFNGTAATTAATATITINQAAITETLHPHKQLGDATAHPLEVADGQAPRVASAEVTGPREVTIRYTEPVTAAARTAYGTLSIGGTDVPYAAGQPAGNGTDTHTIVFTGAYAAPDADGAIAINRTAITDAVPHPLVGGADPLPLADGQPPHLVEASLDLTAGDNGRLTLTFNETVASPPPQPAGDIVFTSGISSQTVTLLDGAYAAARTPGAAAVLVLDISGISKIVLNNHLYASATVTLPGEFVSDSAGNAYAAAGVAPLEVSPVVQDGTPPALVDARVDLKPSGLNAVNNNDDVTGHLVLTFDRAVSVPDVSSGDITINGTGGASVVLSAGDIPEVASGAEGDRSFTLLVSDAKRLALNADNYADPASTNVTLPAGLVSNGFVDNNGTGTTPLTVNGRDSEGPAYVRAIVTNATSIAVIYTEPVRHDTAHYTGITLTNSTDDHDTVIGAANGTASFGRSVNVWWSSETSSPTPIPPATDPDLAVHFDITGAVTDILENGLTNPGRHNATSVSGPVDVAGLPAGRVDIPVVPGTGITGITAAGNTPVLWLGPTSAVPGNGTFPQGNLTVRTDVSAVTFHAGTKVTGLSESKTVTVNAVARAPTAAEIAAFERIGGTDYDDTTASVIELGDPDRSLIFDTPVRVEIPGLQKDVFSINATDGAVLLVPDCPPGLSAGSLPADVKRSLQAAAPAAPDRDGEACRVPGTATVWTLHFSEIGSARPAPDTGTPPPVQPAVPTTGGRSSGGGGGGGGGGGPAGPALQAPDIHIISVSWDCAAGTVSVTAGPDSERLSVSVRTAALGHQQAVRTGDAAAAPPGYGTFTSAMAENDEYLGVRALLQSGRTLSTTGESVVVDSCIGQKTFGVPSGTMRAGPPPPLSSSPPADGALPADGTPDPVQADPRPEPAAPPVSGTDAQEPPVADPAAASGSGGDASPPPSTSPAPPAANGDGCGPGTVSRDGICVVIMPDAADTDGTAPAAPAADDNGNGGGGCLIATAAYGTELAPQVQRLRELRDATVLSTVQGASFMGAFNTAYYAVSPAIADLERQNPAFRDMIRAAITPGIWVLGAVMPLAEPGSEVSVTAAGLLSAVLLAGVYAGPPSVGAYAAVAGRRRNRRPAAA